MGYSARYHATSLVAVFVALAIGILIGASLGGNVLNDTEKSLQDSLRSDLEDAQSEGDDLRVQLAREQEFEARAYPALVGDRLAERRIGVIALGELPGSVAGDIEEALEPTGAELTSVSVVRTPPDLPALAEQLKGTPFAKLAKDPAVLERFSRRIARQIETGRGGLLDRTRQVLLSRSSGDTEVPLDGVILVRTRREDLPDDERASVRALETGIVEAVGSAAPGSVSVEASTDEASSVDFFRDRDVATVDNVDQVAGRVAMIFALLGANGDFGIKPSADRLLPELLIPAGRGGQ